MGASDTIAVVDYGMGNLHSVAKALEKVGGRAVVTDSATAIRECRKVVVPGVGAFAQAMTELKKRKLDAVLRAKIESGDPYLGLCLGLQILFERSEEGPARGLGILRGVVKRFRCKEKVPHMGWNTLNVKKKVCPLFAGTKSGDHFYFVHSYYAVPASASWVSATTPYGGEFCSALWKDNVYATQFHPEKSQTAGLRVLKNFVRL